MADIRINSLPSTATSFNTDDYIAIDGASGGTRKMLAATLPLTDVTLGGASGPSVKSSLSARAPRQGLVFNGTAGATVSVPAFGTADYSIAAWLVWSGSSAQTIVDGSNSVAFFVNGSGAVSVYDRISSSTKAITANGVVTAGKPCFVTYTRAGQIYVNGLASGAVVADTSNYTGTIGTVGQNYDGSQKFSGFLAVNIYNRALSASEVVALYEAGAPAGADYTSAGTALIPANFSSGWMTNAGSPTLSTTATLPASSSIRVSGFTTTSGRKYRFRVTVDSLTAGSVEYYNGTTWVQFATAAGTYTVDFTAAVGNVFGFQATGGQAVLSSPTFTTLGLLLAPDAAQAGGGLTWYDTSGNAANITLPASGVSWNVPFGNNIAASGTNKNITLTPSGTGFTVIQGVGSKTSIGDFPLVTSYAALYQGVTTPGNTNYAVASNGQELVLNAPSASYQIRFQVGSEVARLNATGNFLIGTTTDTGEKLQVNGTGYFAGALLQVGNGSNDALYRVSASNGKSSDFGDDTTGGFVRANNSQSLRFITAGNIVLTLDSSANATFAGQVLAGAGYVLGWNGRGHLIAPSNGVITLLNAASTDFNRLQFGGTTASFPSLKRSASVLTCVLADDSAFATFRALDFSAQGAATTTGANQVSYGGTTATTATAGAQTLPANPVGFIIVNVAGTTAKIPYYAN